MKKKRLRIIGVMTALVTLARNQSVLVHSFAAHPECLKDAESAEGSVNFRYVSNKAMRESNLDKINHDISKEITESGFA